MPIYKSLYPEDGISIFVWKVEESFSSLLQSVTLNKNSERRLSGMKSELHKRGFLAVRHLLQHSGYTDHDLYYNSYGKPLLRDGKNISITHSFNFAGILISDKEAGIDIEKNRDKIVNIQHRFVNTEFDSLSDEDIIKQLTVIWGAKESMYKTYPFGGLSFHDHIMIDPFLFKDQRSQGKVIFDDWKKDYKIQFEFFKEGFTLVYAIEN